MKEFPKTSNVYVIAGPNGAGKTTFALQFLPEFVDCHEFLNADLIAAGLDPSSPESQNVRAGRILLARFRALAQVKQDFGFETTLSGRSYVRLLNLLKRQGYRVLLIFLWLPSPELAVERVANRVRHGGHHVPEPDIRRRHASGIRNLFQLYVALADNWWLYDASQLPPTMIASKEDDVLQVFDTALYNGIRQSIYGQAP